MENTIQAETTLEGKRITQPENKGQPGEIKDPVLQEEQAGGGGKPEEPSVTINVTAVPEEVKRQIEAEQKISSNVMSISLTPDGLVIRDEDKTEADEAGSKLSGVYCEGVQYYDLSGVQYINNTGMAILIDLLKALLEMGVEVQFVNVHDSIKKKIRDLGLEKIINYGENSGS